MSQKQKILHGSGPSTINLDALFASLMFSRLHYHSPLLHMIALLVERFPKLYKMMMNIYLLLHYRSDSLDKINYVCFLTHIFVCFAGSVSSLAFSLSFHMCTALTAIVRQLKKTTMPLLRWSGEI